MTNIVENMVAQMYKDEAIIVEQQTGLVKQMIINDGLSTLLVEAQQRCEELTVENHRLRQMVKDAYNDAFHEGMREVLETNGGISWYDSKYKMALEEFKCPLNDPECKENCGSYGCGN